MSIKQKPIFVCDNCNSEIPDESEMIRTTPVPYEGCSEIIYGKNIFYVDESHYCGISCFVEKLEKAQFEIQRLKSRPNHAKLIKGVLDENKRLHELNEELVKQRNDLLACLKLRQKTEGE